MRYADVTTAEEKLRRRIANARIKQRHISPAAMEIPTDDQIANYHRLKAETMTRTLTDTDIDLIAERVLRLLHDAGVAER